MTVLLDGNVLIALVVADHIQHAEAQRWFLTNREPFVTCPITQGALVRLLIREGTSGDHAIRALEAVTAHRRHEFWSDDIPYDASMLSGVLGHRQVTDAYLAALVSRHGARLVTFDEGLVALHPGTALLIGPRG